jgi:hypothetical protein
MRTDEPIGITLWLAVVGSDTPAELHVGLAPREPYGILSCLWTVGQQTTVQTNWDAYPPPSGQFQGELPAGNAAPYANFVIEGLPFDMSPMPDWWLSEAALLARQLQPSSFATHVSRRHAEWQYTQDQTMVWRMRLLPGPTIALTQACHPTERALALDEVVTFWATAFQSVLRALSLMQRRHGRAGLSLQTNPADPDRRIDRFTFANLPTPPRGASPFSIGEWKWQTSPLPTGEFFGRQLREAIADLLEHFNYQSVEATVSQLGLRI